MYSIILALIDWKLLYITNTMWGLSSENICKSIIIILKFKTNFVPTCIYNNDDTQSCIRNMSGNDWNKCNFWWNYKDKIISK